MKTPIITLLISTVVLISSLETKSYSQTVKKDPNGNYIERRSQTSTNDGRPTGKYYKDSKGNKYPIYKEPRTSKLYIWYPARTGSKKLSKKYL